MRKSAMNLTLSFMVARHRASALKSLCGMSESFARQNPHTSFALKWGMPSMLHMHSMSAPMKSRMPSPRPCCCRLCKLSELAHDHTPRLVLCCIGFFQPSGTQVSGLSVAADAQHTVPTSNKGRGYVGHRPSVVKQHERQVPPKIGWLPTLQPWM